MSDIVLKTLHIGGKSYVDQESAEELLAEIARLREVHLHGCECSPDEACAFARERDTTLALLRECHAVVAERLDYLQGEWSGHAGIAELADLLARLDALISKTHQSVKNESA